MSAEDIVDLISPQKEYNLDALAKQATTPNLTEAQTAELDEAFANLSESVKSLHKKIASPYPERS
ncbi:MAG: hypothetical protein R3B47_10785 [Bacteroidia bacterium]